MNCYVKKSKIILTFIILVIFLKVDIYSDMDIIDEGRDIFVTINKLTNPGERDIKENQEKAFKKCEELFRKYPNTASAQCAFEWHYTWLSGEFYNRRDQLKKYCNLIVTNKDNRLGDAVKGHLFEMLNMKNIYKVEELESQIELLKDQMLKNMLTLGVANCHYRDKLYSKAIKYYKIFINNFKDSAIKPQYNDNTYIRKRATINYKAQAFYRLAEAYIEMDAYSEAIEALDHIIKDSTNDVIYHYFTDDDLLLDPGNAVYYALNLKAVIYVKQNNIDDYISIYRGIIFKNPQVKTSGFEWASTQGAEAIFKISTFKKIAPEKRIFELENIIENSNDITIKALSHTHKARILSDELNKYEGAINENKVVLEKYLEAKVGDYQEAGGYYRPAKDNLENIFHIYINKMKDPLKFADFARGIIKDNKDQRLVMKAVDLLKRIEKELEVLDGSLKKKAIIGKQDAEVYDFYNKEKLFAKLDKNVVKTVVLRHDTEEDTKYVEILLNDVQKGWIKKDDIFIENNKGFSTGKSEWKTYRGNNMWTGYIRGKRIIKPRIHKWFNHVKVSEGEVVFSDVNNDKVPDIIFSDMAYEDMSMKIIDGRTNKLLWKTNNILARITPSIINNRIYLGKYCLDGSTGKIIWENSQVVQNWSQPLVVDDVCIIPGSEIVALNKETGNILWSYKTNLREILIPAIMDNILFCAAEKDYSKTFAFALDIKSGNLLWQTESKYSTSNSQGSTIVCFEGGIIIGPGPLILDPQTGKVKKELLSGTYEDKHCSFSSYCPPCVVEDRLIYGNTESKIYAVSTKNGDIIWEYDTTEYPGNTGFNSMCIIEDIVSGHYRKFLY